MAKIGAKSVVPSAAVQGSPNPEESRSNPRALEDERHRYGSSEVPTTSPPLRDELLTSQMFSTKHGVMTSSPSPDAKRLFGELWLAINEITRGIDAELKPFGLTHAQFQVLLHIDLRPGLLQRELTERLSVTSGNVSMLVTRLQNAGLLVRVPEGAAHHLHLTPAGKALFESLRPTRERFISELFSRLSPEEIRRTADSLRTLRSH